MGLSRAKGLISQVCRRGLSTGRAESSQLWLLVVGHVTRSFHVFGRLDFQRHTWYFFCWGVTETTLDFLEFWGTNPDPMDWSKSFLWYPVSIPNFSMKPQEDLFTSTSFQILVRATRTQWWPYPKEPLFFRNPFSGFHVDIDHFLLVNPFPRVIS